MMLEVGPKESNMRGDDASSQHCQRIMLFLASNWLPILTAITERIQVLEGDLDDFALYRKFKESPATCSWGSL